MTSRFCRAPRGEKGQVLVMFAASMVALLAFAAFAIDFGFTLHAYSELQASTNAAATAGATALTDNTSGASNTNNAALIAACSYSGITSSQPACPSGTTYPAKNADGDLPNVAMLSGYPQVKCLTTMTNLGLACINGGTANAIQVIQEVSVPTFFARAIGINSIKLRASALSAMKGGNSAPGNIVVIMDTTASMASGDSDSNCKAGTGLISPTRLDCAKWGMRTFLMDLSPCSSSLSSCGTVTNGNVANPVSQITLLTFPGLTNSSYASTDYSSCGANFRQSYISQYSTPTTQPPYFTIIPPSSDYRTSDTSGLNGASSNLVQAIDWKDGNPGGCTNNQYGLQDPGGESTYYAGVINEAQADITALTGPRASMQSAIILLSDGDAEAKCNAGSGANCAPSSNFTATTPKSYGQNECHQAIAAATNAGNTKNALGLGTWVYSIAFGSPTSSSSSCDTDSPPTGTSPISGCSTMTQIASDPTKFYSDDAAGCVSADHPSITSLGAIFTNISYDWSFTRLLPAGTP